MENQTTPDQNVYSVEYKLAKIEEFARSGMSIRAFASANGIPDKTFWCWVEKARDSGVQGLPPRSQMAVPSLPPVDITREAKGLGRRGRRLGGGRCARSGARGPPSRPTC